MRQDGFDYSYTELFGGGGSGVHDVLKYHVNFSDDQEYVTAYRAGGMCGGSPCYTIQRTVPLERKAAVHHGSGPGTGYGVPAEVLASTCTGDCEDHRFQLKWSKGGIREIIDLNWPSEELAQKFADAFNRLVYGAHRGEIEQEEATFSTAAAAWRTMNPKPPLSPEADREWILAENAIKEKSLDSAVDHYEAALEIQPMWPTGWFDLAMIYGEQQDFPDAADAMKHYLELVPDAPDARQAREQMIIWQDKAANQQQQAPAPPTAPAPNGRRSR